MIEFLISGDIFYIIDIDFAILKKDKKYVIIDNAAET